MQKLLMITQQKDRAEEYELNFEAEGFTCVFESDEQAIGQRIQNDEFKGIIFIHFESRKRIYTLGEKIRKISNLPLFVISDKASDIEVKCALQKGFYYFTSVFSPLLIVSYIKLLSDSLKHIPEDNDDYDIKIDDMLKKVYVRGKEVRCVGKQYEVLKYLIQRKNSICSLEEIYRGVWKTDIGLEYENNVHVIIGKIQKAIFIADTKTIENVRGEGYRLSEKFRYVMAYLWI